MNDNIYKQLIISLMDEIKVCQIEIITYKQWLLDYGNQGHGLIFNLHFHFALM